MFSIIAPLIQFVLLKVLLPLLLLLTLLGVIIKYNKRLNQLWFSFFLTFILKSLFTNVFDRMRDVLFKDIDQIVSSDPELRKEKAIRILEIGTGEGPNLKWYPNNTRLISVDCNPTFKVYLEKNQKKFPHVKFEKIILARGEDIKDHVKSESVDAVVIVHVLCSVDDQTSVFKEAHRTLVKGGKAFIMEHVRFEPDKYPLSFKIQQLFAPIWALFCGGCDVTRDTRSALIKAGFKQVDAKYSYNPSVPFFLRPHVFGVATK